MEVKTSQSIEVILNQWATLIQISILTVLVLVFFALWRNFPRRVVLTWLLAWSFNLLALCSIYLVLLLADSASSITIKSVYLFYALFKTWFVLLLIHGMIRHLNQQSFDAKKSIKIILSISLITYMTLLFSPYNTLHIQILVYSLVGLLLLFAATFFLIKKNQNSGYLLQIIFLLEGLVFSHHAWVLIPTLWGEAVPSYMTRISFFDSISELLVGITCLYAIAFRLIEEYKTNHESMEKTQKQLRKLVDNDSLTGLWNRRKLPVFVENNKNHVSLVYIDINNFKSINDTWGHNVGDRCLVRVATEMRRILDNHAGIFRLGGDEFLAVIPNHSDCDPKAFINQLKWELSKSTNKTPPLSFSAGLKTMMGDKDLDEALNQADQLMYQAKQSQ